MNFKDSVDNLSMYDSAFKHFKAYNIIIDGPFSELILTQAKLLVIDSITKRIQFPLYNQNSVINPSNINIYDLAKPKIDKLFSVG